MILEELKSDIYAAIRAYLANFRSLNDLPSERQKDIRNIKTFLASHDPISAYERLTAYVDNLTLPLYNLLIFIDINNFYWKLKSVLDKEKYQEVNFYKQVVVENTLAKSQAMTKEVGADHLIDESVETKLTEIMTDMKLLRAENKYLYATVQELNEKVISLEAKTSQYLQRAQLAENELNQLKKHCSQIETLRPENSNLTQ